MQSKSGLTEIGAQEALIKFAVTNWQRLTDRQKAYLKKGWAVITYKWRWQIAMNIPYLAIFLLDRTIPAVHQFDIAFLETITSKIPIPAFISSWMGL